MKLILYSGLDSVNNQAIDAELVRMLPSVDAPICYIPSASVGSDPYYKAFQQHYSQYGIKNFGLFFADINNTPDAVEKLMGYYAIFLSGGNTFYFLAMLKKYNLLDVIKSFVAKGGILIGESAGSIVQTPNINLAGIPYFDCDYNAVGLQDLSALGLTDFEFSPHYAVAANGEALDQATEAELIKYSETCPNTIYACADGTGIAVREEGTRFFGDVFKFEKGSRSKVLNQ